MVFLAFENVTRRDFLSRIIRNPTNVHFFLSFFTLYSLCYFSQFFFAFFYPACEENGYARKKKTYEDDHYQLYL